MLLAEAAHISENLRRLYRKMQTDKPNKGLYFSEVIEILRTGIDNTHDDYEILLDMFYPKYSRYQRQFATIGWARENICKSLSISPLIWDEALVGKPIIPVLAIESPEFGGEGMTVKQALTLMPRVEELGFFHIARMMNEKEAVLFWSRVMDETAMVPIDRFLQWVSYTTGENPQSIVSIRRMLETRGPAEIMVRLRHAEKINIDPKVMQPGQAFMGPIYRSWNKTTAPAEIYAETISKPRRYLHITEFPVGTYKGVLYNRDRQVMGKVTDLPIQGHECILEVEAEVNIVKCVTDIYSLDDDWNIHKLPYKDRVSYLSRLGLTKPVKLGKFMEAHEDLTNTLESIEAHERLRLTLPDAFMIGGEGGWMILKDAFHIHLLVSAVKRDEEFNTHIKVAAMDGYEMYQVGTVQIPIGPAQHMRNRLARDGLLAGTNWLPVDEYAIIVMVELKDFSLSNMTLNSGDVHYVDDNMGYSDVSQLTDLIEMGY